MLPKKYAILVNIISEISIVVYANSEVPPRAKMNATFDVSDGMKDIVENICSDLEYLSDRPEFNMTACQENFLSDDAVLSSSPPAIQTCRLEDSVVFNVSDPGDLWRLVVLVPNDGTVTDQITFNLMESNETYGKITALSDGSFTVWTANLDSQGRHSAWLRGPGINPWKGTKQYDIDMNLEYGGSRNSIVNAVFQWDNDDEKSACFKAKYSCNGQIIAENILWKNKEKNKIFWEVKNIPEDEKCELYVLGVRGATFKNYRFKYDQISAYREEYEVHNDTPTTTRPAKVTQEPYESSTDFHMSTKKPNQTERDLNQINPSNITIVAVESAELGWDVTLAWVPPTPIPIRYDLTLVGDHVRRNVSVSGDKSEVTIRNVQDEGFYYVIFDTIMDDKGEHIARTSRNAVFPEKTHLTSLIIAVGVLSASIVLVAAFWCLRKRQADRLGRPYSLDMDEKPSKDAMETFDVESSKTEENWEVGSKRLLLHEVVGEGAFGVVRRGTLGGEEVAVKMLKDFPTLDEIRSFHAEIDLMKLMKTVGRHAHVLNLVECCPGRRPLILTEYCSGGDLLSYLRCIWDVMVSKRKAKYYNNNVEACEYRNDLFKCKFERQSKLVVNKLYDLQGICDTDLTSRDLLSFCRQIAMGMDFLASNKVVHRDLAARNILVARDRTLKIADFGLSRDVYEENQYKQKGNGKMPVKWMALESLERKIYTTKSDIWSFGVVVWEIVTVGGSPYPDVPPARLLRFLREGYRMQKPNNCSMELYDLMLSCWHAQPSARPSFSELHRRLDELLNSVCAHDYLSLEMNDDVRPVLAKNRYVRMIKEKLGWSRSESYSYGCRAAHNHYSSPPALPALHPA